MPSRELSFPVFDADNHFYEPQGSADQVPAGQPQGRHRLHRGPRPHQDHGAQPQSATTSPTRPSRWSPGPGAQEEYFRHGSGGKSYREVMGKPMKAIPAFRDPAARLEVHGRARPRLHADVPDAGQPGRGAHEGRPRPDPRHHPRAQRVDVRDLAVQLRGPHLLHPGDHLPIVDRALEELQWCLERGAKTVLVRPAPVPGYRGSRSFGLEEFDPFWQACVKAGIPVSMHASDSGYSEYLERSGSPATSSCRSSRPRSAASRWASGRSRTRWRALVCHGALSRNPDLRILSIENGADWVPYLFKGSRTSTRRCRRRSARTRSRRSSGACTSRRSGRTIHQDGRHVRHRPGDVRLRLAAPRGPERSHLLRRRTHRLLRIGHRQDHGRQLDEAHEGVRAGQEASLGLIVARRRFGVARPPSGTRRHNRRAVARDGGWRADERGIARREAGVYR